MLKVSLSVLRDEAHGRLNGSNVPEDDEGIDDEDLPPPSSFQASSTDPSRVNADPESTGRDSEAAGIQSIDFNGDDEATWRSLQNTTEDTSQKVSTSTSAVNSSMDQDQEMWDIVDEFEKEGQAPSAVATTTQTTTPEPTDGPFDPGDDCEDIYL